MPAIQEDERQDLLSMIEGHEGFDASFIDFYLTMLQWSSTSIRPYERIFRHYVLADLFSTTIETVSGDVAECGCYAGLSSLELCYTKRLREPEWTGEGFHIFDSFEGLSAPTHEDQVESLPPSLQRLATQGSLAAPLTHLQGILGNAGLTDVRVYQGWIPTRFDEVSQRRFAFVHIDVDLFAPTKDSLEFFYPRLNSGGVIITDDYEWPGAAKAFDDYAQKHQLALRLTNTGQAYFVKGDA